MTATKKLEDLKAGNTLNKMGWFEVNCSSCLGGQVMTVNASERCCRRCGGDGVAWEFRGLKKRKK